MPNTNNHMPNYYSQLLQNDPRAAIGRIFTENQKQILEIGKAAQSQHKQLADAFKASIPQIDALEQHQKFANNFIHQFTNRNKGFSDLIRHLADGLKLRIQEDKESLQKLANIGWYIDSDMPFDFPEKFARAIEDGDEQHVVEVLKEYFRDQLDVIEQKLVSAYPNRKNIFEDAFNAHRDEKFTLSVPVLLTQADGMWHDAFQANLFMSRDRRKTVGTVLTDKDQTSFEALYIEPLFLSSLPLWQSQHERDVSFNELNRHQILHGEVIDYGTEQNSLKIIAFLNYLLWILNHTD